MRGVLSREMEPTINPPIECPKRVSAQTAQLLWHEEFDIGIVCVHCLLIVGSCQPGECVGFTIDHYDNNFSNYF